MSSNTPPAEGLAAALGDVTDRTRDLVRAEVDATRRELQQKAAANLPAVTMLAIAAGAGLMACSSAYRLSIRLLERVMDPIPAAVVATATYGTIAAAASVAGARRLRKAPTPFPAETLAATRDGVAGPARS